MKRTFVKTILNLIATILLVIAPGCSQFETPLEIPESGTLEVITSPDVKCILFHNNVKLFEWEGSRKLNGLVPGIYFLNGELHSEKIPFSESFEIQKSSSLVISFSFANLTISSNVVGAITSLIYKDTIVKQIIGDGQIKNIVPETYQLLTQFEGYIPNSEILTFRNGENVQKDVQLRESLIKMINITPGTFTMGCTHEQTGCWNDETPTHQVTLSAYEIGKFEVTQKEWQTIMGTSPSYFKGENRPVEQVYWNDIITFCNALSSSEGLTPVYTVSGSTVTANWSANGYRLPTEAEWEYAARGGALSTNTLYSGSNTLEDVGWYNSNSGNTTHDVGTKQANELGLYDMSGNVFEWCWDWYGHYSSDGQIDPKGPFFGTYRILRGGGWNTNAGHCRVADRGNDPDSWNNNRGFRLARTR